MGSVLVISLLGAAAPASADGLFGDDDMRPEMPSRFLKFEPLGLGTGTLEIEVLLLKATCDGPFRIGIAAAEGFAVPDMFDAQMFAPVHVGYTLWSNPRRSTFFYGMVPDVYVELSATPFGGDNVFTLKPAVKLVLCCDIDYYGLGAGLEAGWINITRYDLYTSWPDRYKYFYFAVRLRALPFGIGLN
jgi:hypothetical protein